MAQSDSHSKRGIILVSRFSALGDVALVIPVLYSVCRLYPDCRFVMLTRRHPANLFVNAPANLTVKGIDTADYKGVKGLWRLSGELLEEFDIDTYVDLHDVLRTQLLRLFMNLRGVGMIRHIKKGRRQKKELTRRNGKVLLPLPSTPERYADAFRRAGFTTDTSFVSLYDSKAPAALFSSLSAPKADGEKWIAIAPFARHRAKTYPPELMKEVVSHYTSIPGYRIFLFGGGPEEADTIDFISEDRENTVNVARLKAGLDSELALLSHCDVMISMDSANMHMASLAGIPVVSIWGATHPYAGFLGWKQTESDAVQLDMVCRPCSVFGHRECRRGDYHCLRGISPERIIGRVDAHLDSKRTADVRKA